jgi:hypothetical protein
VQRIGVFVCHCGSNIAATVDVKKVVEMVSHEPGVVHAEDYQYMCSEVGQAKIIEAIRRKTPDRSCGLFLLPAYARDDFPQNGGKSRPQPVHGRDCKHP